MYEVKNRWGSEWSDAAVLDLRALWGEGHSTAEIGRRMGLSKNAVVGKAHRINLPARPSPIRPNGPKVAPQPVRTTFLPPLPSEAAAPPPAPPSPVVVLVRRYHAPPPPPRPPAVTSLFRRTTECCFPVGTPRTPDFRFCGDPAQDGKPYCEDHHRLAHVRVRDQREDAA